MQHKRKYLQRGVKYLRRCGSCTGVPSDMRELCNRSAYSRARGKLYIMILLVYLSAPIGGAPLNNRKQVTGIIHTAINEHITERAPTERPSVCLADPQRLLGGRERHTKRTMQQKNTTAPRAARGECGYTCFCLVSRPAALCVCVCVRVNFPCTAQREGNLWHSITRAAEPLPPPQTNRYIVGCAVSDTTRTRVRQQTCEYMHVCVCVPNEPNGHVCVCQFRVKSDMSSI